MSYPFKPQFETFEYYLFFVMEDFPPKEMMSIKPVKALIRKYLACRSVCFNEYVTPLCVPNFKMVLKLDCSFVLSEV